MHNSDRPPATNTSTPVTKIIILHNEFSKMADASTDYKPAARLYLLLTIGNSAVCIVLTTYQQKSKAAARLSSSCQALWFPHGTNLCINPNILSYIGSIRSKLRMNWLYVNRSHQGLREYTLGCSNVCMRVITLTNPSSVYLNIPFSYRVYHCWTQVQPSKWKSFWRLTETSYLTY